MILLFHPCLSAPLAGAVFLYLPHSYSFPFSPLRFRLKESRHVNTCRQGVFIHLTTTNEDWLHTSFEHHVPVEPGQTEFLQDPHTPLLLAGVHEFAQEGVAVAHIIVFEFTE